MITFAKGTTQQLLNFVLLLSIMNLHLLNSIVLLMILDERKTVKKY